MGANSICGFTFKSDAFKNSNEIILYKDYFKEKKDALYLYVDRIVAHKNEDNVDVELESEYLLICKYDKASKSLSSVQNILLIKNDTNKIPGIEAGARFSASNATSDFIKRYIYHVNPQLFTLINDVVSNYGTCYSWIFLAPYIDNIEHVEKLCKTMSIKDVIGMMENRTLIFEDARKLKQVIGLPSDIISRLDEMGLGCMLSDLQRLKRDEMITVDEIRYMFDFLSSLNTLSRKKKLRDLDGYYPRIMKDILECVDYGYKARAIVNAIAKELMFYSNLTNVNTSTVARELRDCCLMATKMNQEKKLCQNFSEWHSVLSRNFNVFQKPRHEEFINAAANINNRYSYRTDDYLIQCPTTERELFDIGFAYHNCLPTYRDRIIDNNAIILSIYKLDEEGSVIDKIPAYTFEINRDLDIIQLKTFFDADVSEPSILDIVKTWRTTMKKKG